MSQILNSLGFSGRVVFFWHPVLSVHVEEFLRHPIQDRINLRRLLWACRLHRLAQPQNQLVVLVPCAESIVEWTRDIQPFAIDQQSVDHLLVKLPSLFLSFDSRPLIPLFYAV